MRREAFYIPERERERERVREKSFLPLDKRRTDAFCEDEKANA